MSRVSVQRYLSQGGNHRVDCCIGSRAMLPTDAETARLLAGLEVALAAALREAGRGRCLKCGHEWETAIWVQPWDVCHCDYCGGVLAPVAEGRWEG